jgi:transcription elongation factor GreA
MAVLDSQAFEVRSMSDRAPMTPRGYEMLKQELHRLKTVERPANVKDIEEARAHGDISENAEFHAAKERQGHLNARIAQLDDTLARAQVIDSAGQTSDQVRFGATVLLCDSDTSEEVRYTLVGEEEADVSQGTISITSPVARALLGKKVDDEVEVRVPKGTRKFEILEISFD